MNWTPFTVQSILILDAEGNRIATKHYGDALPEVKQQIEFEKLLFQKTHRANAEIITFEKTVAVYRNTADVFFYVTGSTAENELVLLSVLNALYDSISLLLRFDPNEQYQLDHRTLLENLDYVLLVIDELVDNGIIIEEDPNLIASRVAMKGASGGQDETPIAEQTMSQGLRTLKDGFAAFMKQ